MKPSGSKAERQSVHILLVEDDPDDVWVMRNLLGDRWDGPFKLTHVELLSAGLERLREFPFDIILLDLSLPDSQGLETFFTMHAHAADVPIVVLSGYNDESTAVKAVQAGAQDYLVKGQVDDNLLVRSIRYAIERTRRHKAEAALRDASEEFRAAKEIQQRLFPSARAQAARLRHRRRPLSGQGHRGRLLRLYPHAGQLPRRGRRRRQQPRHGTGPADVGNAGLPAHAGPGP